MHGAPTMDHLKYAATQTKHAARLPSSWLGAYNHWVLHNASAVSTVESSIRSLSYIIPGRFRDAEIASESLNSGVQLLSLYHDALLSRGLREGVAGRRQHQSVHNRYTGYWSRKSGVYRRTAVMLQVVQYTELLLEMIAKRRGEKARWRVVVVLEAVKAMCRLILMRMTGARPGLDPPLPVREPVVQGSKGQASEEGEGFESPPSERSEAGSETWTMPRTSLTLPPLPGSEDISSYLLSKVLTADDIKPPKTLLHRTTGLGQLAEVLYILRPLIYASALAYYSRKSPKGTRDWRPWLLGLSIEYGARQLAKRDLETRRPGGARGLTQLEREQLKKRGWNLAWWGMRGAFYENVTRGAIQGFANKLKGKPVLDMVGNIVEDYEFLWETYYFPTATM